MPASLGSAGPALLLSWLLRPEDDAHLLEQLCGARPAMACANITINWKAVLLQVRVLDCLQ